MTLEAILIASLLALGATAPRSGAPAPRSGSVSPRAGARAAGPGENISGRPALPDTLPGEFAPKLELYKSQWLDPKDFLPSRDQPGNAVDLLTAANASIRKIPTFPAAPSDAKYYAEWPELREALRLAFDASKHSEIDFLEKFSARAWEPDAVPDLTAAMALNRALCISSRHFVEAGQAPTGIEVAQAALSIGDLYMRGAPSLLQAVAANEMMTHSMRALLFAYQKAPHEATVERIRIRLANSRNALDVVELRSIGALLQRWPQAEMAAGAVGDPEPAVRADALLFIEQALDPKGWEKMGADRDLKPMGQMVRDNKAIFAKSVKERLNDSNAVVRKLAIRVSKLF